jgi:hypothetical protein
VVGAKLRSELFEFRTQLPEVVYFSIEDDAERAVRGRHRLLAAGNIENREAPETQKDSCIRVDQMPFIVGTAMFDPRCHAS